MTSRQKLSPDEIAAFVSSNPGWQQTGHSIERLFTFSGYGTAVGFAMRIALLAEKRDHHPDIVLSWGKVRILWSTHDADGITALDTEMAMLTDRAYSG